MQRSIDGPRGNWLSVAQAARWLGLKEDALRAEMRRFPWLLPTTEIGKGAKIYWLDLIAYNQIRSRLTQEDGPAEKK